MLFFIFLAAARKIARLPEKNILPDFGGLQLIRLGYGSGVDR